MGKNKRYTLKEFFNESENPKQDQIQDIPPPSKDEIRAFAEECKSLDEASMIIQRASGLKEFVDKMRRIVETAERVTMAEDNDWFDNQSRSRDIKEMKNAYKIFEKTAAEMNTLQQRLESTHSDLMYRLGKYYKTGRDNV